LAAPDFCPTELAGFTLAVLLNGELDLNPLEKFHHRFLKRN
jgi:hypothetical protein